MTNDSHTTHTAADAAHLTAVELWNAGDYDEAFAHLDAFLRAGHPLTGEEELRAKNMLAMCERARGRHEEARRILLDVAPLADACRDDTLRGKFHNGLAATLFALGDCDGAIEHFAGASYFYDRADQHRLRADVENNFAVVLAECGRPEEAREHAAVALGSCPADAEVRAQVLDTLAQIALVMGDADAATQYVVESGWELLRIGNRRLLRQTLKTAARIDRFIEHREEAERLRAALARADWNLTHAAAALGYATAQALYQHLKRHFPELLEERRAFFDTHRNSSVLSRPE